MIAGTCVSTGPCECQVQVRWVEDDAALNDHILVTTATITLVNCLYYNVVVADPGPITGNSGSFRTGDNTFDCRFGANGNCMDMYEGSLTIQLELCPEEPAPMGFLYI